jgi:hypothetical protein
MQVWLDRDSIEPGSRWKDSIRNAISSGGYFLACFSKESCERDKTYMNEELTLAIEELRMRPADKAWFIPVLLNRCEVPDRNIGAGETLQSLQFVDLYENWDDGLKRILSVIHPISALLYQSRRDLADPSARIRIRGVESLGVLGKNAETGVPLLLKALDDENETVKAAAAEALGKIGLATDEVVDKLLSLTPDDGHPDYPAVHANKSLVYCCKNN